MDYTRNQASWTLLYKKKVTLSTGEEEILYDRLKKVDDKPVVIHTKEKPKLKVKGAPETKIKGRNI